MMTSFTKLQKWNIFTLLVVSLLLALLMTACAPSASAPANATPEPIEPAEAEVEPTATQQEPTPEAIVLTDGLGREVVLAEPAQRIVSIAPSNTEILYAIGAGDQVIGRDEVSDYPAEVLEVASIGSTYGELNTEAILALEPDLVLAAALTTPEQVQTLETLDVPLYLLPNPLTFEELFDNLLAVGEITGHQAQAQELVNELSARVDAVTGKAAGIEPVMVFYEVDGTDPTAPWTTGAGTFQDVLIGMAGGENIASDIEGWGQMSLETLVTRNPEVVIFGEGPWVPTTAESLAQRTGWGDISAVQQERVYGIDTNWVDRPGPRLVQALERMAEVIHPELFE
ncbi:MAG: cobalamin-binding protein [Anaerolineales bacterium]|jgi:iron complex transport system substrate-binding protein